MTGTARLSGPVAVCVRSEGGEVDRTVDLAGPDVTVAEVFAALGLPPTSAVDGMVPNDPDTVIAGEHVRHGSLLEPVPELSLDGPDLDPSVGSHRLIGQCDPRNGLVDVAVVAGLDAGHHGSVSAGVYRLRLAGSEGRSDPSGDWLLDLREVARPADEARPWHEQGGSTEVLDAAACVVTVGRPVDPEPARAERTGGTVVQRPPRTIVPAEPPAIEPVAPPAPVPAPSPLSWATLLTPVPIAVMMAVFFRPIFALFAAMGPIMALGRWFESRRRFRRDTSARNRALADRAAALDAELEAQSLQMAALRWAGQPHVAELRRRAMVGSVRLWERRCGSPGFLAVAVGVGPHHCSPNITSGVRLDDEVHAPLQRPLQVRSVPHLVDVAGARGVGVHGPRSEALAVVRSVVLQLATLQGPADVALGILCPPDRAGSWDWCKWLPHVDRRLVGCTAAEVVEGIPLGPSDGRTRVIIVDEPAADVAAVVRAARAGGIEVRVICVAEDPTSLPAACDVVVSVREARAEIQVPNAGSHSACGAAVGLTDATARSWARALAPYVDRECPGGTFVETERVGLRSVLPPSEREVTVARWRDRRPGESAVAGVIGCSASGSVAIDLVADGPHILVAGTTGSGKSELLRTLVASLATTCPPTEVNFVLVDFKGGGAFDAVARLPHVAGLITDLDEAMIDRALTSLRAELVRREQVLRSLGVSTFEEAARRSEEPLARLVVIVDEFAALATHHPDLLNGIVDLAARGRSLGMHLVLATQRPSGVVDQKIRANTNLKIALRVQDAFDSQDVVGIPDAAMIDRRRPGRAYFRVASEAPVVVQIAHGGRIEDRSARCAVAPYDLFGRHDHELEDLGAHGSRSELEVVVDELISAAEGVWADAVPIWSEPLPDALGWNDLDEVITPDSRRLAPWGLVIGVEDRPEQRCHLPWRWEPEQGSIAVYGAAAGCGAACLASIGAAAVASSEAVHLYVIDGAGGEPALSAVPETGAYVRLDEIDRIDRMIALLERAVAERRAGSQRSPRLLLLIENIAAVIAQHDELEAAALVDRLGALARDGARHGVHLAITARSVRDVPHRLAQQLGTRLVMALADPSGYLALGLRTRQLPPLPPMRAVDVATGRPVQIAQPPTVEPATTQRPRRAQPVRGFPTSVAADDLPPASLRGAAIHVPIGVESRELGIAELVLRPGHHALVVGGPGSGRTTALATVAGRIAAADDRIEVVRVAPPAPGGRVGDSKAADGGPSGEVVSTVDRIDELAARTPTASCGPVVLVDDAELLPDELAEACARLLAGRNAVVIAATSPAEARSLRSWTAAIRAGGTGLLLGSVVAEPDLLGARGERNPRLDLVPGRGCLVDRGRCETVQVGGATAVTDEVWLL